MGEGPCSPRKYPDHGVLPLPALVSALEMGDRSLPVAAELVKTTTWPSVRPGPSPSSVSGVLISYSPSEWP